jgi:hypothetical protein
MACEIPENQGQFEGAALNGRANHPPTEGDGRTVAVLDEPVADDGLAGNPGGDGGAGGGDDGAVEEGTCLGYHGELTRVDRLPYLSTRWEDSAWRGKLNGWPRPNQDRPCPECESYSRNCRIAPAGTYVACEGSRKGTKAVASVADEVEPRQSHLSVYEVNATVAMMVGGQPLLRQHLEHLRKSGLTEETIRRAGIYSEARPEVIGRLLGWKKNTFLLGPSIVIPFFDAAGNPTGYHRLRPHFPREDKEEKPIKYEAPKGQANRAYIPPGTRAALADTSKPLIITEGEKKALAADQAGHACVGISGVWSWQKKREKDESGRGVGPPLGCRCWRRSTGAGRRRRCDSPGRPPVPAAPAPGNTTPRGPRPPARSPSRSP